MAGHGLDLDIRCEIVPVAGDKAEHALFFHRFQEADSSPSVGVPSCSVHPDNVAAVQCIDCVNYGLPVSLSYHCSNKCFLDSWKKHTLSHPSVPSSHSLDDDDDDAVRALRRLKRRNSWPPVDMTSWFDERVEVVPPRGKLSVNRTGWPNVLVPLARDVAFSFSLGSMVTDHSQLGLSPKVISVTSPVIQRRSLCPRTIFRLSDEEKFNKLGDTKETSQVGSLSVLTYNVLADIYAYPEKYYYCPHWALTWEYRRKNLLHEILVYDADIVCLQEIQSDHFENFFQPELMKFGYSAIYKKKAKEVYTFNGYAIDGCAIFFRNNMFKNAIAYELEYSRTALSLVGKLDLSKRDQARVRLSKDNIALVAILDVVENSCMQAVSWSRLCVVNTHICASNESPDVKLLQVSDLINEIEKIVDRRTPLLICGDINSTPASDPYVLLANHEINPACGKKAPDPLGIYQHIKLHHPIKLASAYKSMCCKSLNNVEGRKMVLMDSVTGEPKFTRLTRNGRRTRKSTLDYIFFTEDSLEVEGLLEIPDFGSVGRGIPSPFWSSDHIALMASFRITRPFLR